MELVQMADNPISRSRKKQEQEEREKIKQEKLSKKEYESGLIKAIEHDLIHVFNNDFEREGYDRACINLSLKSTRDDILSHVPENDFEYNYINDNYEKILNRVKKIYENDKKAKEQLQELVFEKQIEEYQKQQEEVQKNPFFKVIMALAFIAILLFVVIKWGFIILCGVGFIFFMMILMASKGK